MQFLVVYVNISNGMMQETIKNALLAAGLHLETLGGEIPSVEVSGLTGQGLDQLVDTISAVAEMSELRAEMNGTVFGYVLDSKVVKGLGYGCNNDSMCCLSV